MEKSLRHAMHRKQRPERKSARKQVLQSPSRFSTRRAYKIQNKSSLIKQLEEIFAFLPESVIACDKEGKILRLNAAALKLFEVTSEDRCRGIDYREFLQRYTPRDEQQRPIALERGFGCSVGKQGGTSSRSEEFITFQVPSGRKITVSLSYSPMIDQKKHGRGMIYAFHEISQRSQKALHFQHVHEAVQALSEAIFHLPEIFPEQAPITSSTGSLLITPSMVFIAQQLVDLIRHVLGCHRVSLKAIGQTGGYYYYIAGSGFTTAHDQPERETSGRLTMTEVFGTTVTAHLHAGKEVILPGDRLHLPSEFIEITTEKLLLVPLFVEKQLAGLLCILKAGLDSVYTPEEIDLVKAVAAQALLVVEYLRCLHVQAEAETRKRVLYEVNRLSNEFLILASHELRTPLTGILGNLQLAQRRLENLRRQIASVNGHMHMQVTQTQQPLRSASQSARLQQRIINDIVDDARIQTNQLDLHLQEFDLTALLRTLTTTQQRQAPEHTIMLEIAPDAQEIPVLADPARISQVFTTYLANALAYSPIERPVIVQITVEHLYAKFSVHNDGPGIPQEEQEQLWERSYRARGYAIQHELDLSLGFHLYLCRAFIEHHQGNVGVQSAPGRGATFWCTLPIHRE